MFLAMCKGDVEGAEAVIFGAANLPWLEHVENMVIELHGQHCREVFQRAIPGRPFNISRSCELTVCRKTNDRLLSDRTDGDLKPAESSAQ